MLDGRTANPLVIIDEVDKVGALRSASGISAAFTPALPGLLEPESTRAWDCPYHRLRFDMGHISWVMTSNHLPRVPEPGAGAAPSASDGGAAVRLRPPAAGGQATANPITSSVLPGHLHDHGRGYQWPDIVQDDRHGATSLPQYWRSRHWQRIAPWR